MEKPILEVVAKINHDSDMQHSSCTIVRDTRNNQEYMIVTTGAYDGGIAVIPMVKVEPKTGEEIMSVDTDFDIDEFLAAIPAKPSRFIEVESFVVTFTNNGRKFYGAWREWSDAIPTGYDSCRPSCQMTESRAQKLADWFIRYSTFANIKIEKVKTRHINKD